MEGRVHLYRDAEVNKMKSPPPGAHSLVGKAQQGSSQRDGLEEALHGPRRCDSERQRPPRKPVWLPLSRIHKASQTPVGKLLQSH